jgi:hypothetical protein
MKDNTKLVVYAREELDGGAAYDGYRPKLRVLRQVAALLPRAQVVVISGAWCSDCRREVPRFARIVERLPGWTVELRGDDAETRDVLNVRKIPTFVVRNPDTGEELGRIVESPESGSLEGDLLALAERHPSRLLA